MNEFFEQTLKKLLVVNKQTMNKRIESRTRPKVLPSKKND